VIVPPVTWVSDIAAVLHCGFTPVFADINPRTLSMDTDAILAKVTRTPGRLPHARAGLQRAHR
jgi:CDP-6-deoxy-D-xylo-4-hexulose-3-dehydrase